MNALAINIDNIKRAMNKNEQYSPIKEDGSYKITFGAYGRQITVTATPLTRPTVEQMEDGDYPVSYTIDINKDDDFCTTDYDTMFNVVANIFMSYYQD